MSRLFAVCLLVCVTPVLSAADLATQRAEFKRAWSAAQHGDLATLTPYLDELADYPLYPYLRFAYLDSTLDQQPDEVVQAFLKQQWALPVADDLREDWLLALAKRRDWKTLLVNYQDETDTPLRCAAVSAHLAGDDAQDRDVWVVVAEHLWLSAQQRPDSCAAAFDYLTAHQLISDQMRVRRTELELRAHQFDLAKQLLPQLAADDRTWAQAWLDMAANPAQALAHTQVPDEARYHEMLIDGVRLVARRDPAQARHLWHLLSHEYHFAHDDQDAMQQLLALQYAWHLMPDAGKELAQVDVPNAEVLSWRVRSALRTQDWPAVLKAIADLGSAATTDEWRYWKARALAATGKTKQADPIYKTLAKGDGYYAYLADDHLQQAYDFTQQASQPAPDVMAQLAVRPAFLRARELVYAGLFDYAEQEWQAGVNDLSNPARCQAALLATEWDWYGRTIRTFANAGCWQDLAFTYPLAYQKTLLPELQQLKLDPAWVYGLVRAESMFLPGAVSNAGAMGLMQLMPATGRHLAGSIGMDIDADQDMLDPHTNLTLGSHYMQRLLAHFDGSEPLATAAYNTGTRRVTEWLPSGNSTLPADIWVDTIPYDQTRGYVRRVLAQAVVFDWRLHGKAQTLSARLGTVPATADPKLVESGKHGS
ncbi:MAG TPA: transglycosylase SLT domain-containing protein [Gammaproteobacteria bacterium]|nr:transglycosylase SLT domain-containing protein [Gammaproteobacteria bacterium]